MKQSLLISTASAILLLCVITVHSIPAENPGGQSAADAEREAWKKVKEQTAEFLAHEREYVMSQRKPIDNSTVPVAEVVSAANAAPVAAAPAPAESAAAAPVAAPADSAATTLPPVTTVMPTNSSVTSVGNTTDLPQTTTPPAAA